MSFSSSHLARITTSSLDDTVVVSRLAFSSASTGAKYARRWISGSAGAAGANAVESTEFFLMYRISPLKRRTPHHALNRPQASPSSRTLRA